MIKKLIFLIFLIGVGFFISQTFGNEEVKEVNPPTSLKKEEPALIRALKEDFSFQYSLFKKAKVEDGKYVYVDGRFKVIFTVDPRLQEEVKGIFKKFKVKYGSYVAIEPETGRVLVACSSLTYPDLNLKRSFPAASTFKVITASAALELGVAKPDTVLTCGGVGDSCSPYVWLNSKLQVNRKFNLSFATSANPFFGNLGRLIGKGAIMKYARLFGFNSNLYNFPWGTLREPLDDYELALTAAGLGDTTVSPFHEALISQTIVNDGVMMKPFLVYKVVDLSTGKVYHFKPEPLRRVISKKTADEIKRMMELTVKVGTVSDKRHFRKLRRLYPGIAIGGKTGTLSERSYPEGRCEWFIGFVSYKGRKIAFSSVAVNNWFYHITGYELGAVASEPFIKLNREGGVKCASSVR